MATPSDGGSYHVEKLLHKMKASKANVVKIHYDKVLPDSGDEVTMKQCFHLKQPDAKKCKELVNQTQKFADQMMDSLVSRFPRRELLVELRQF